LFKEQGRRQIVGARKKLNGAFMCGSLVIAAIAGFLTQSFAVFLIGAIVLISLNFYTGEIRPGKRGW
jgi:hypothetical protein